MKKLLVLCVLIIQTLLNTVHAENDAFFTAYTKADVAQWKPALDSVMDIQTNSEAVYQQKANVLYGYVALLLKEKNKKKAKQYLKILEEATDKIQPYSKSSFEAYKAAIYGFKIALTPWMAPIYGPKSLSWANQALETDDSNWFAHVQKSNVMYFMPAAVGGSKSTSTHHLEKAKALFKASNINTKNWNYLNVLQGLVRNYRQLEKLEKANKNLKELQELAPGLEVFTQDLIKTE